jgi:hypothetical protein
MNWTLGATPRGRPELDKIGTVNFSTADKPTFFIDLANPGIAIAKQTTQLNIIQEGWGQFQTDGKGGAELFSFN